MGRPKKHDERTAAALLDAAEAVLETDGIDALTARRVADEASTSTRALYSLFGSKEGLLGALGARAFDRLREGIANVPATGDPAAQLVAIGTDVFRASAIDHPATFRLAVQRTVTPTGVAGAFDPARIDALRGLEACVARLAAAGQLDGRSVPAAALHFHALCEGLAALELRGVIPRHDGARIWREALTALVAGFAATSG